MGDGRPQAVNDYEMAHRQSGYHMKQRLITEAECREREKAAFVAGTIWADANPPEKAESREAEAYRRYGEGRHEHHFDCQCNFGRRITHFLFGLCKCRPWKERGIRRRQV